MTFETSSATARLLRALRFVAARPRLPSRWPTTRSSPPSTGSAAGFARAMQAGGHDGYWPVVLGPGRRSRRRSSGCGRRSGSAASRASWRSGGPTGAPVADRARARSRRLSHRAGPAVAPPVRLVVTTAFAVQENLEHLAGHGHLIGLGALIGPEYPLALPVLAPGDPRRGGARGARPLADRRPRGPPRRAAPVGRSSAVSPRDVRPRAGPTSRRSAPTPGSSSGSMPDERRPGSPDHSHARRVRGPVVRRARPSPAAPNGAARPGVSIDAPVHRPRPDARSGASAAAGLAGSARRPRPAPALAHEERDVGDYSLEVGFIAEPVFVGERSGLEFHVTKDDQPVSGLDETLKAEVIYGEAKRDLPLIEREEDPGWYESVFIPTAAGKYTFHLFGTIEGTAIDESFTSSPTGFNEVQEATVRAVPGRRFRPPPSCRPRRRRAPTRPSQVTIALALGGAGPVVGLLGARRRARRAGADRRRSGAGRCDDPRPRPGRSSRSARPRSSSLGGPVVAGPAIDRAAGLVALGHSQLVSSSPGAGEVVAAAADRDPARVQRADRPALHLARPARRHRAGRSSSGPAHPTRPTRGPSSPPIPAGYRAPGRRRSTR